MTWRTLGAVLPGALHDARLTLHWAAQLVSAPGTSLLPAESDYSHTNLGWDATLGVLAGRPVGSKALRAALVFENLELAVLEGENERASFSLAGSTMNEALAWLEQQIGQGEGSLSLPDHDMPSHPLGRGAPFSDRKPEARTELGAWFANASAVLEQELADESAASPVRCWPHHFDLASLITLDRDEDAEDARSIGVGLSPGDGSYDQPYFYVTPWPYPDAAELPGLSGGAKWHIEGFTAAVLTGERVISTPPERQVAMVKDVLDDAVRACRSVLEA